MIFTGSSMKRIRIIKVEGLKLEHPLYLLKILSLWQDSTSTSPLANKPATLATFIFQQIFN